MTYDFSILKKEITTVLEWLAREYASVRTGRATPTLLDGVSISAYGARLPLRQVAAVSVEDPRTLRVAPWDKGQIKDIDQAISQANLGVSTIADGAGLRVIFPSLTEESRLRLVRLVEQKLEQAKVALRRARDTAWQDIQAKERSGDLSEDDKFRFKNDLQKLVDEGSAKLEEATNKKIAEIKQ